MEMHEEGEGGRGGDASREALGCHAMLGIAKSVGEEEQVRKGKKFGGEDEVGGRRRIEELR